MVRQRSRRSLELFWFLAYRFLAGNMEAVVAEHDQLCGACGLDPAHRDSRSAISHILRRLAQTYRVVYYEAVPRKRPRIWLRPPEPPLNPLLRRYVRFCEPWNGSKRALFETLGSRALAAEFMYIVATYESGLARVKHHRGYWFFPIQKIAKTYHISPRVASSGLQALVELGVMQVVYGRRDKAPAGDEFGRANRYYFTGFKGQQQRERRLFPLRFKYQEFYQFARPLAGKLQNGASVENVEGLCQLIARKGLTPVKKAVLHCAATYRRGSPRRSLAYLRTLLESSPDCP
jgi:hypothetical protein